MAISGSTISSSIRTNRACSTRNSRRSAIRSRTSQYLDPSQFRGIGGLDLETLGIPDEVAYVERYCEHTGGNALDGDWNFYLAYNMFRIAAILQGIMKRVADGTAASAQAIDAEKRARPMADLAWRYAQKVETNA